jgi:hypothetical protein
MTKKEKIAAIKAELERQMCGPEAFVKNVGKVFFIYLDAGCVLRDKVYYGSIRHGIEFEMLSLDAQYFAGSKEHAYALQEAFGGSVYASEFCHYAENSRELYLWAGPDHGIRSNPIPFEEAVEAIFS